MYMTDAWGAGVSTPSSLYKVNLNTGAATFIGNMGVTSIFGLVYDPVTDKLYGSQSTNATGFYEIDRSTGVATFIGNPGHSADGLTYVGSTGDIAGLLAGPGSLHRIDRNTGASAVLSPGAGFVNNCGIAWGAATNTIYAIDWAGDLYAYDVANNYARTTLISGVDPYDGLAAKDSCATPKRYCTAKVNSLGCTPAIGFSGASSAAALSGFIISASSVRNQKSGLLLYGFNGQSALPFQGGILCVNPPIRHTGVVSSGGNSLPANDCSGVYSIDMNAFAHQPGPPIPPLQLLMAGTVVDCQWWGRDQGFPAPNNTTLSNGLEYVICP